LHFAFGDENAFGEEKRREEKRRETRRERPPSAKAVCARRRREELGASLLFAEGALSREIRCTAFGELSLLFKQL